MFSCINAVGLICRQLEACDVISLRRVSKGIHKTVSLLLVGAVVNKQEMRKDVLVNVSTIPLLGINERFPLCIIVHGHGHYVRRLCRIVELKAEMFLKFYSPYPDWPVSIYVVDGNVKHIISFDGGGNFHVRTCYPTDAPLKLQRLLDDAAGAHWYGSKNPRLSDELEYTFVSTAIYEQWTLQTYARSSSPERRRMSEEMDLGLLYDVQMMSSKRFVQYMVEHD